MADKSELEVCDGRNSELLVTALPDSEVERETEEDDEVRWRRGDAR